MILCAEPQFAKGGVHRNRSQSSHMVHQLLHTVVVVSPDCAAPPKSPLLQAQLPSFKDTKSPISTTSPQTPPKINSSIHRLVPALHVSHSHPTAHPTSPPHLPTTPIRSSLPKPDLTIRALSPGSGFNSSLGSIAPSFAAAAAASVSAVGSFSCRCSARRRAWCSV